MKKKIHPCLVKEKFLFWNNDHYEHKWRYLSNKGERLCIVCEEREIFFGYEYGCEDWRPLA